MMFLTIVYVLCVFYIIASYYTMSDGAYHIVKVAALLPIAGVMIALYFIAVIVAIRFPKTLKFADWLHTKLDVLEKVIKNER